MSWRRSVFALVTVIAVIAGHVVAVSAQQAALTPTSEATWNGEISQ